MAVLGYLRKRSSMSLNRLTNSSVSAIQLHGTFHLERSRICRIARDSDEHEPFLIRGDSIVYDLGTGKCGMAIEDFLWRGCWIRDGPVEDGSVSNHSDCCIGDPFPEDDILGVNV